MEQGFRIKSVPVHMSRILLFGRLRELTGKSISEMQALVEVGGVFRIRQDLEGPLVKMLLDNLELHGVRIVRL